MRIGNGMLIKKRNYGYLLRDVSSTILFYKLSDNNKTNKIENYRIKKICKKTYCSKIERNRKIAN